MKLFVIVFTFLLSLNAYAADLKEALRDILGVYNPYNIHGFIGPKVIAIAEKAIKEAGEVK